MFYHCVKHTTLFSCKSFGSSVRIWHYWKMSVLFSATANGELLPTYVVYKALHLMNTWTEGGPAKVRYNRTKSGWFDSVTFEDWFFTVVVPWAKKLDRKKVIIGDNLSSHLSPQVVKACERENITFVCLPPNSTHLCQPLDAAVYSSLKVHWRAVLSKWKLVPGKNKPTLPKDLFPNHLRKLLESMADIACQQTSWVAFVSVVSVHWIETKCLADCHVALLTNNMKNQPIR